MFLLEFVFALVVLDDALNVSSFFYKSVFDTDFTFSVFMLFPDCLVDVEMSIRSSPMPLTSFLAGLGEGFLASLLTFAVLGRF